MKGYNHVYYFAQKKPNAKVGLMVCAKCHKPIDPENNDWTSYKKSTPDGDWKFVTHHRACTEKQDGWVQQEQVKAEWHRRLLEMKDSIDNLRSKDIEAFDHICDEMYVPDEY